MSAQSDLENPFEDDSFSVSSWDMSSRRQDQIPWKISSNFLEEDDSQTYQSQSDPNISPNDWNFDKISKGSNKSHASNTFTHLQMYKINNVNQKIKVIAIFQNQNRHFTFDNVHKISAQANIQMSSDQKEQFMQELKDFSELFQNYLESVKMYRLGSIPEDKRVYYLKKSDQQQIQKKKIIKTMICEKVRESALRKGLIKNQQSKKSFDNYTKLLQELLKEQASFIMDQKLLPKLKKIKKGGQKDKILDLSKSVQKHSSEMANIHRQSINQIDSQLKKRQSIIKWKTIERIENKRKILQKSQQLVQIIDAKQIFEIMPERQFQQFLRFPNNSQANFSSVKC